MKRTLLALCAALLLAAGAHGQNTVTVRIGTQSWTFALPVNVSSLKCDTNTLAVGQSSTCTVTLDSPAPAGGYVVAPYNADAPLALSPPALVMPANTMSATFTVTRPAATAAGGSGMAVVSPPEPIAAR